MYDERMTQAETFQKRKVPPWCSITNHSYTNTTVLCLHQNPLILRFLQICRKLIPMNLQCHETLPLHLLEPDLQDPKQMPKQLQDLCLRNSCLPSTDTPWTTYTTSGLFILTNETKSPTLSSSQKWELTGTDIFKGISPSVLASVCLQSRTSLVEIPTSRLRVGPPSIVTGKQGR